MEYKIGGKSVEQDTLNTLQILITNVLFILNFKAKLCVVLIFFNQVEQVIF